MSDTNDMRRDFEAWHEVRYGRDFTLNAWVSEKGRYAWDLTQERWLSWQAATEWATASQWQPIETAPRDGTRVLLVIDHGLHGDKMWTGLWADGWMVSYGKPQNTPTYWMPLPPPPAIRQGGAE